MSTFNYKECGEDFLNHVCDPCDEGEADGVRSVFFYKDGVFSGAPTFNQFKSGYEAGKIILIPETRGTFDGGTPSYGTGFGDRITTYESSDYKLTYTDMNYALNRGFYNDAQSQTQWNVGWRTDTLIHLSEKKVTIYGKDPHSGDLKKKIYWEVEVTWNSKNKPQIYASITGVWECYTLSA